MSGTVLHMLCAGAAQGLVEALQVSFEADTGASLQARFGAVGAMKEALLAGESCDLLIVTEAMIDALVADGLLQGRTKAALGGVATGVAVRAGEALPDISTGEALAATLHAASALYIPDPQRATAGIHVAGVVRALGLDQALADRVRSFPNGATAMRALATGTGANEIGCTQVSEILRTEGLTLVGALPSPFELNTVYAMAATAGARQPELARRLVALLSGPETRAARERAGFSSAGK
jgi:molybdate transport system substrate-binding protein